MMQINPTRVTHTRQAMLLAVALLCLLPETVGCKRAQETRKLSRRRAVGNATQVDAMLEADFQKLENLPNNFPLQMSPPTVLLDARFSDDGKDVLVEVATPQGVANGPWNTLEVVSGNVNFRSLGVRPGDTVKCYLFPDSETRTRQNATGEVDMQMVTHEATDLVVAQVLDDHRLQIEGSVIPPRNLIVKVPEQTYAEATGLSQADIDRMRDAGQIEIDSFGVIVPATQIPLDALAGLLPTVSWPPRIEIWRDQDERMRAINRALADYAKSGEPALGWEPTPDAPEIERLVESFNRWLRSLKERPSVDPPKVLSSLPSRLLEDERLQPFISAESLNRDALAPHEGRQIQQAMWFRDIGDWTAGTAFDPLPRAQSMFDWVVRNVTLTDSPRVANHRPWETLLYGRGTAAQRAWVFSNLCRQQRIPNCVISLPTADNGEDDPWLWCGVVDHDQLYLFDPQLGLPAPSSDGAVASLSELRSSPELLEQLGLPDNPYPVSSDELGEAKFFLVAEPFALTTRSELLQDKQSGSDAIVLHLEADAAAELLEQVEGVDQVALWPYPYDNLRRELRLATATTAAAEKTRTAAAVDLQPYVWTPELWKARMLHFRGRLESQREAQNKGVLHDPVNDHRNAAQLYLSPRVRTTDNNLNSLAVGSESRRVLERIKADATYWLAMLKFEEGEHEQSLQWLNRIDISQPEAEHLAAGVQYLTARTLEAMGKPEDAAKAYQQIDSPQSRGDRLRAERLTADEATTSHPDK